jgi:hypothetical protein
MSVTPATWEAEIERLQFKANPSKKKKKLTTPYLKLGVVIHTYNPLATWEA